MTISNTTAPVFHDVWQGTPEWHAFRCGMITGSIVGNLITPTGKFNVFNTRNDVY